MDEQIRREYWREQMEKAYAFMMAIRDYPVEECGEKLVFLPVAVEGSGVRVDFSDTTYSCGVGRLFYLREGLVQPLIEVGREMNSRGWVLKVEDGYRNRSMQTALSLMPEVFDVILKKTIWELEGSLPDAELLFRRITALTAVYPKVGTHMSGSALDISVLDQASGADVDRGGPYLEMSELTPMGSPFVSEPARRNRKEITALMAKHGFIDYLYEFWHYSSGDAYDAYLTKSGRPGRYGAIEWDGGDGQVKAMENVNESLHTMDAILSAIEKAKARL